MRGFISMRFCFYLGASLLLFLMYFSLKNTKISSEYLLNNIKSNHDVKSNNDIKSNNEIKNNHDIKSNNDVESNNDIKNNDDIENIENEKTKPNTEMKYILQWTSARNVPFVYMGVGQQGFIDRNCEFTNCFITADRSYLGGVEKFDVIAFAGPEVIHYPKSNLPATRSPHQKYAFASIESSDYYPLCSDYLNDFFNWTWTFKTKSDARWGYLAIRDADGTLIGPNSIMHWIKFEDMKPVSDEFKEKLKSKKKTAAWFVSNCYSKSKRELFVKQLQNELQKFNLDVDIYGNCGPLKCPTNDHERCLKMIETDYYFYLSFENSFCEDYVTEKLLHALQHNALPVVFGAANYTRFMPDGVYLNARELGAKALAEKMHELIKKPDEYAEYFRWQNHYSYHNRAEHRETDDYCSFCTMLNDKELVNTVSRYENMKEWWNTPNRC